MKKLMILGQWDDYMNGWQTLINSGDVLTWNILLLVAFIVRAIIFMVLLMALAERLFFEKPGATRKIFFSLVALLIVTLPFLFAGQPLVYPKFQELTFKN